MSSPAHRRLAAILSADVVGYTRLMHVDEGRTIEEIKGCRRIFADVVQDHEGHIVDAVGDNILVEFQSVVNAVEFALVVQQELEAHNADQPNDRCMRFRIGINLGDVVADGGAIYGDGVNVAARLESLAVAGGICISESVRVAIGDKLPLSYEFIGEKWVKNSEQPISAYYARLKPGASLPLLAKTSLPKPTRTYLVVAVLVAVIIAGGALAWLMLRQVIEVPPSVERTAVTLPDKPSLAVLPFDNMSDDPDQEYFADGITEDIITDFSRLSNLKVIAWNTSAIYKGKTVQPQEVGNDLGVGYVLDGSVRKSGDRLRITAQLVDAGSGNNVWAERYDRRLIEVFALQDEVARKIVAALAIRLTAAEKEKLGRSGSNNIAAYDAFLRGQQYYMQRTKEGNELARDAYRHAIELDPTYARAYGALAVVITGNFRNNWSELTLEEARARALELAQKAVALDRSSPQAYWALGYVYLFRRQYDEAAAAARQAVALAPNYADGYGLLAFINNFKGRANDAVRDIRKAMALNPYYTYEYPWNLGRAYYTLGRHHEAIDALQEALEHNVNAPFPRLFLAASYVRLGRQDDAEWEIDQIEILSPGTTLTHLANTFPIKDQDQMNVFLEDLRKAGLPE